MSDHAAYSAALEPWAKKAARERMVIDHVRYSHGHVEVMMIPRSHAMSLAATADLPLWTDPPKRG